VKSEAKRSQVFQRKLRLTTTISPMSPSRTGVKFALCTERAKTSMLLQIIHIQVTAFCPITLDTAQGCLAELTSSHVWP